jgi:hypothetical protein
MKDEKSKSKREEMIEKKALEAFKRIDDSFVEGFTKPTSYVDFVAGFKLGYEAGQRDTEETIIVI